MTKELITNQLTKIGVFYDGNYFLHVSNYYNYVHPKRARLSIAGLHQFIRQQVAAEESVDVRHCKIVDAHYFRGRLNAQEASQKGNLLYYDRVFDDILMSEGVVTHYLPIRTFFGKREEKGVEVWLSLEAFELTQLKNFNVIVLIGSDGDYVPLARKLNTLGARVMLVNWEFEYANEEGVKMITRTSSDLIEEVTYPLPMNAIIEGKVRRQAAGNVEDLFVQSATTRYQGLEPGATPVETNVVEGEVAQGEIHSLKNGYGFIKYPPNNLFFHYTSVVEGDFSELQEGDPVEFTFAKNDDGQPIAKNVRLMVGEDSGF
jgi:cold shock CspA family protein/uncharacterized LabA/DUF88 family protein